MMFFSSSAAPNGGRCLKKILLLAGIALMLTACGFKLRGAVDLPFKTVATNINDNSAFGISLLRKLRAVAPGTAFVKKGQPADAILTQMSIQRLQKEMSLDVNGRVEEYELSLIYQFNLTDSRGNLLLPPTQIISHELIPYDEDQSEAFNQHTEYTYSEMEKRLVDKIVRYISSEQVINRYEQLKEQGE